MGLEIEPTRSLIPYTIFSIREWATVNNLITHLYIKMIESDPYYNVFKESIHDGILIINISEQASPDLFINDEGALIKVRYAGKRYTLSVPLENLVFIACLDTTKGPGKYDMLVRIPLFDPIPNNRMGTIVNHKEKIEEKPKRPDWLKVVK